MFFKKLFAATLAVHASVVARTHQIRAPGFVGPLTTIKSKRAVKVCNIMDYGAKADNRTDIFTGQNDAFSAYSTGGVVLIPSGDYALSNWVTVSGGNPWALQLDGIITRTGTEGVNMIFVEHGTGFEMFSSTGNGAIQGNGYLFHIDDNYEGPRLLRTYNMFSSSFPFMSLLWSTLLPFITAWIPVTRGKCTICRSEGEMRASWMASMCGVRICGYTTLWSQTK